VITNLIHGQEYLLATKNDAVEKLSLAASSPFTTIVKSVSRTIADASPLDVKTIPSITTTMTRRPIMASMATMTPMTTMTTTAPTSTTTTTDVKDIAKTPVGKVTKVIRPAEIVVSSDASSALSKFSYTASSTSKNVSFKTQWSRAVALKTLRGCYGTLSDLAYSARDSISYASSTTSMAAFAAASLTRDLMFRG